MPPRKKFNKSSTITTKESQATEVIPADISSGPGEEPNETVCGSRRSGRQRMSNSRYRDMEVQITPRRHQTKAKQCGSRAGEGRKSKMQSNKPQTLASEGNKNNDCSQTQQQISCKRKMSSELHKKSKCSKYDEATEVQSDNNNSTDQIRCPETTSNSFGVDTKGGSCQTIQTVVTTSEITSTLFESSKADRSQLCCNLEQEQNLNSAMNKDIDNAVASGSNKSDDTQQLEYTERVVNNKIPGVDNISTASERCLLVNGKNKSESIAAPTKGLTLPKMYLTESQLPSEESISGMESVKEDSEVCSENKITLALDLAQVSNPDAEVTPASSSKSSEKNKDNEKGEKVKIMEEEMMSLLNLFFTDSDQKKGGQLEENVDTVSRSGLASDVCQVMVVSGTDDDRSVASCDQTQLMASTANNKTSDYIQVQNGSSSEAQVHALPVGSAVFLVDKDTGLSGHTDTNAEGNVSKVTLPPVSTESANDVLTVDKSNNGLKQVHFLVKTSKNKVEINHDGVLSCMRCGSKLENGVKRAEHVCRSRVDNLLHVSDDGTFCCTKCDYKTEKKVNWYKHKLKHQERRYQCSKCDYKASTSSNLKRHILSHDDVRVFGCKLCWATFPQKVHLLRHIKSKHQPHSVQCSYCDYVCAEVQPDLITHMKTKHPELCNINSDSSKTGESNGMLDDFLRYKCDKCNVYTFNRKDLQQHMKVHKKGPELKFFCEMCSFVTECESRLKRHMLTHTKEKPFSCNMCNYRGSLREHVKRHLKTKHKVDISFGQQKKIKRYGANKLKSKQDGGVLFEGRMRNKKPYMWSDTRNREKHFACNFCSMMFTKLISLFKHVHVQHSQLMPPDNSYSCVVCDYTTNQYKRLLLHMRKVHSTTNCMNTPQKQVYMCMSCSYSTPYRLFLHAHLKKEHNMQIVTDKYMMDASKHSSAMVQTSDESERKPGSIIKNTVAGKMGTVSNPSPSKDSKMVLLQLTPDGPMTPVVINMGDRDTEAGNPSSSLLNGTDTEYPIMETGITDAECTLDMQCEVIFDDELGQVLQDTNVNVTQDSVPAPAETTAEMPVKDLTQVIQEISSHTNTTTLKTELQTVAKSSTESPSEESTPSNKDQSQTDVSDGTSQVLQLSSGDFLEINGQIYKIEMEETTS